MVGQRLSGTIKISHAEQVGKEIGPAVEKRRGRFRGDALGAGYHERVNQFLALLRVGVPYELPNFLRFGQTARQVKGHPPLIAPTAKLLEKTRALASLIKCH